MSKKKSRSLPSTPAGKNRPKRLQKTPLVKFVEEPKSDSSSDEDFHPSDVSDEKIDVSEDEINQELTELADEASEYEMMKQYEKMFNDEEENKETSSRKKSKQQSNETNMDIDHSTDEEEDDDYKPVYEEQSEDDDWANDDMANEAIELMNDNEKFEKMQEADSENEAEDDAEDDEDLGEEFAFNTADENSDEEQHLDGEEDGDNDGFTAADHQAQLRQLIKEDPEFAKFIEEEDKDLLDFGEDEEEEPVTGEQRKTVTFEMVNTVCKVFKNPKSSKAELRQSTRFAVKAFSACMLRISPDVPPSNFVINEDKVFDSIIRMCFNHLAHALLIILEPIDIKKEENGDDVSELFNVKKKKVETKGQIRYKHWKEFNPLIKEYLRNLNVFLIEATSTNIMNVTLRAVIDNIGLFISFEKLTRNLIRILIRIWSRKTHDCRCLAFVALTKMIRLDPALYPAVYKSCYVSYVASTRSISLSGLPLVSFMQKSFAELTFLQPTVAYQYAFVYIRQCAIHLRNATIAKRKDLIKTIYNWQYIQCLYLWTQVLSNLSKQRILAQEGSRWLRDLIHPLTQIICGTMKAFNAHRYTPLKAHCVRMLLSIQRNCNVFIPTLSFAADLLSDFLKIDSNKPKKGKGTVKAYEMKELIKFTTDALEEAGYRARLAEEIRSLIVEAAFALRHNIAFADAYTPVAEQFRKFLKAYKNREQIIYFKKVFNVVKTHFEKSELLTNARAIDLGSHASMGEFAKAVDVVTDELNKYYSLMKKREVTVQLAPQNQAKSESRPKFKKELKKKNKKKFLKKKVRT